MWFFCAQIFALVHRTFKALLQYKDHLSWKRDTRYIDETVVRPFYVYSGIPYAIKAASLCWNGLLLISAEMVMTISFCLRPAIKIATWKEQSPCFWVGLDEYILLCHFAIFSFSWDRGNHLILRSGQSSAGLCLFSLSYRLEIEFSFIVSPLH